MTVMFVPNWNPYWTLADVGFENKNDILVLQRKENKNSGFLGVTLGVCS